MRLENTDSASFDAAQGRWFAAPEDTGTVPDPVLRSWLTEPGLLTARLRKACASEFQLQVLEHSNPVENQPTIRRILLRCGQRICVYAETLIPAGTLARHPWLALLGDEPLGERLSAETGVKRSDFRFGLLVNADLPTEFRHTHDILWSRQSDFTIADDMLTVTEIFLPDIGSCTSVD